MVGNLSKVRPGKSTSWPESDETHGNFLKRTILVNSLGWRRETDDRQARSVVDKSCMSQAKARVTPGSKKAATPAAPAA